MKKSVLVAIAMFAGSFAHAQLSAPCVSNLNGLARVQNTIQQSYAAGEISEANARHLLGQTSQAANDAAQGCALSDRGSDATYQEALKYWAFVSANN